MAMDKIIDGVKYIPESEAVKVYERIYRLLKDQKEYFKTRSKELCQDCKKREAGYIKWFEENYKNKQI